MRKQVAVLGVFAVFALMLAACGGATAVSTSTSAPATEVSTMAATEAATSEATSAATDTVEATSASMPTEAATSTTESMATVESTSSMTGTAESMPTVEMTGTSTVATMVATETVAPTSESMITGTEASMSGTNDIASALQSLPGSTTIVQALTSSGLLSTLQDQGPYTIFVPDDAAFAQVPAATLTALMNDQTQLKSVLLYHVVQGNLSPADLTDGATLTTLNGATLKVSVKGSDIYVNDAKVAGSAVNASNGTLYVIDSVLMPPGQ
jgi:transforming growth factor-beta-induced protein